MGRKNVLAEDPTSRTEKWLIRFNHLPEEKQQNELRRCSQEFFRFPESRMVKFAPDLSMTPETIELSGDSDSETVAKVQELIAFIKARFGPRCADAACAIMDGCETGAEIGAKIGVARQTADEHIKNLRSKDVKAHALRLGLVTREAFASALRVMKTARKAKALKVTRRKVVRRKTAKVS